MPRAGAVGPHAWSMLGWLFFAQLAFSFGVRGFSPLGPAMADDLGLGKAGIGGIVSALFLGQFLVAIPGGLLVDRIGARRVMVALGVVIAAGLALISQAGGYAAVVALAAIIGIGYGALTPATGQGVQTWFPLVVRGTAMGIKQMAITLGSIASALALLPLAAASGWRTAVLACAALAVAATAVIAVAYRDPVRTAPSLPVRLRDARALLRRREFVAISVACLLLTGVQMSLLTYAIFFGMGTLGLPLLVAGGLYLAAELGGSIGRLLWGPFSDRRFRGDRIPALRLATLTTLACALASALLPRGTPLPVALALMLVFGVSACGFNGLWMNAAAEAAPPGAAGLATGTTVAIGSWGVIGGPPLFGHLVDVTGGYAASWIALALGAAASWVLLGAAARARSRDRSTASLIAPENAP